MLLSPFRRFLLQVFLWLPICFGAWYYLSPVLVLPITILMNLLLQALFPTIIATIEQQGHLLNIVTQLTLAEAGMSAPNDHQGILVFTVNPLIYSYGLPLLTALVIAVPDQDAMLTRRLTLGFMVLLLVGAMGVSTAIFKTLIFDLGTVSAAKIGITAWEREAVALAYQFNSLVLPGLTPITLWLFMCRGFVAELAPNFRS